MTSFRLVYLPEGGRGKLTGQRRCIASRNMSEGDTTLMRHYLEASHTHPDRRPAKMQRITVISIKAPRLVATRLGQTQDCCQFIVVWHTHTPLTHTHHTPLAATNTESHTKPKPGCSDCATCALLVQR